MDADDRQNLHGWLARADKEDLGKLLEYMGDSAPKKSKQERLEVCLGYAGSMFTELDKAHQELLAKASPPPARELSTEQRMARWDAALRAAAAGTTPAPAHLGPLVGTQPEPEEANSSSPAALAFGSPLSSTPAGSPCATRRRLTLALTLTHIS